MDSSQKTWFTVSLLCGLFLVFTGIFYIIFPVIYRSQVDLKTNLVEDSFLYPIWRDLPLPIYKRLYFFNITNADEFLHNGTAMRVEEVGPYVYIGTWIKEDMQWSDDGTVSYREVKTFHFSYEESVGSEEDRIYTLNAPYIAASDVLHGFGTVIRQTANTFLHSHKLIINKSIKELSFGGYKDPIMSVGKFYRWDSPFRSGSFAWFYGKNATDDGDFSVHTGEKDHSLLNVIKTWNEFDNMMFWKGKYCNMINGTNAEFHPPLEEDQTEYTFFQPLVCRSVTFRYTGKKVHKGILTKRFENHADIFSKDNPDNHCFDMDPELKSGVLDVSSCQYGAPVVLSFPHFYLADPSFLENIEGLEPNKDLHGSHIDAEPITGVTVDLSIKFQMNMKVKPLPELVAFQNVTAGVYPVFWLDLLVVLPDNLIDIINYQLFRPRKIVYTTLLIVTLISIAGICVSYCSTQSKYSEELEPLLKRSKSQDFNPNNFHNSVKRHSLIRQETSHEYINRIDSYNTCSPLSSPESFYESFNFEESDADVDKFVEAEHSQRKERRTRMSFKDATVLTVI